MMLKFGGSPNPVEDDFGLYAVNDEGDSDFQVFKCATLLLFNVCVFFVQKILQSFLVVLAVICIPWMLLMKPIYLLVEHRRSIRVKVCVLDIYAVDFSVYCFIGHGQVLSSHQYRQ